MRHALLLLLAMAILTGCKITKPPSSTSLQVFPVQNTTDTKIIHIETIDTVYIEIPAQSAERTTTEKESHLETDYAESDARINEDGTLSHTLNNKPTKHPVPVKNERDTIYIDNAVEVPVPAEVPVKVERELTAWQKTRLNTWDWLAAGLALSLVWIGRKPLLTLARRFI